MKIFEKLYGFLIIVVLGYFVYKVIDLIFDKLSQIDSELGIVLVTVSGTIIVSLITVIVAKSIEKKQEIRREQRNEKIRVYKKIIDYFFDEIFSKQLENKTPSKDNMLNFMTDFLKDLIPWGGDKVMKSFLKFREQAQTNIDNENTDVFSTLFDFEKMLFEIRKDLGHSNKGVETGDILKLFITDIKSYIK